MPDYLVDTLEQVTGKPTMELEVGDTLLLCSDGVWEPLSEEELVSYVVQVTNPISTPPRRRSSRQRLLGAAEITQRLSWCD